MGVFCFRPPGWACSPTTNLSRQSAGVLPPTGWHGKGVQPNYEPFQAECRWGTPAGRSEL
ncbi:MAG: hypothetical protein MUC60_01275 [Oscillatoria sp. Prado101]|nr:hypothetical protein [Oscillatoria sp. Prado101]